MPRPATTITRPDEFTLVIQEAGGTITVRQFYPVHGGPLDFDGLLAGYAAGDLLNTTARYWGVGYSWAPKVPQAARVAA
jgi:hypothetical protein